MDGNVLFVRLVEASALSPVFAERSLGRVLDRAGLSREALTPGQIEGLLPQIEQTLRVYLPARKLFAA